ncbi:MAG: HAMP domain-containing sensor histidine kinase [Acidobacteriota bacterium]
MTHPLTQMTVATEEIARGKFDIRLDVNRSDEIGRLGRAITDMSTRLDRLIRSQKRLLSDVAHELGSPIARIQIGLGILQNTLDGAHQSKVQDVIDDVEHMSELVQELLAFSRAEVASADRVHLEPLSLEEVATAVVGREGESGVDIRMNLEPGVRVVADRELLDRALANLVRNSIRYAGRSGPVEISAKREGSNVIITIRDHGPGVPADSLEKLFEPFYRPEPARRRCTGGTGLGLAIVKTCITTCRGTVTAANLEPAGFAASIVLPSARPSSIGSTRR